ncbi:TonB-dependent receptor plug domain-containing protein [Pelomonas sp. Root1217]|uniref:TonB-dependent receptor plug domain-containing protein n=1 Tax=Pelomonas sp. Root1217 TaxID=1736430 RepID=UPI0009E76522|nr:TonB-dependent receptor plug domain-containing protein [Pelomonas sp. Root1217]
MGTIGFRARWLPFPLAISLLLDCGLASAAEPSPAARYVIEQPSQDLGDALRAIGRQTSTSVLFDPRIVAGRLAKPVSGRLSGVEAITAAVAGADLEVHVTPDGAVVVRSLAAQKAVPAGPSATTVPAIPASPGSASAPASVRAGAADGGAGPGDTDVGAQPPNSESVYQITRVEVTGSRLRRVDAEGPAPVNVYTARDIERSGQPNLQRFLAGLNEVSASAGEGGFSRTLGQGTVQLRGMPLGSTLVLVNGRKLEAVGSSTGSVFNLNLIPLAAIERVEVVPSGSSAVYGGDALAGVVNIVLKKSIDGSSLAARLGTGRGFRDGSVSIATGGRDADGSYLLLGSFSRSTPLTMVERSRFANVDFRAIGGADERQPYCAPGNVSSISGNLPGLGASVAGIPRLASGQTPTLADYQATAGMRNLCNRYATGGGAALIHGTQTFALHSLAEHRLSGSWSAFGEAMFVKDRTEAPSYGVTLASVKVPAANLFNPFGVDVRVSSVLGNDSGIQGLLRQGRFTRALAGLKGQLGEDWDAELAVSTSSDHGSSLSRNDSVNATALAAALASQNPATAFNPFTAGKAATDEVLRGILADTIRRDRGRKDQASAIVRGSVGQLWAGPVDVVVGAEAARDWYDMSVPGQSEIHGNRRSSAAYGEARVPLLAGREEGRVTWNLAALTLAARRDTYSDFGSANTFQGGLEVRPTRNLLIRGSAAGSFKPPTLLQTNVSDLVDDASFYGLVDPARGGEAITSGSLVRTTNKELKPERGQARGIGAVWEPEGGLGTRLSASHWQLRVRSMIALLAPQSALNYESAFPTFVTRGPAANGLPGVVTSIKAAEVNYGRLDTAGTDVDAAYAWTTSAGRATVAAGATRVNEYRVQLTPGAPVVDRLGRRFIDFWAPRWKGRLSVGLDAATWNLGLTSRYLGNYKDAGTSERRLGNYWIHDLAGSLNLKKLWPELLPGFRAATFGVSVTNLADREPQFVPGAPNFDVTQADWRGRYVSARLTLDW